MISNLIDLSENSGLQSVSLFCSYYKIDILVSQNRIQVLITFLSNMLLHFGLVVLIPAWFE